MSEIFATGKKFPLRKLTRPVEGTVHPGKSLEDRLTLQSTLRLDQKSIHFLLSTRHIFFDQVPIPDDMQELSVDMCYVADSTRNTMSKFMV